MQFRLSSTRVAIYPHRMRNVGSTLRALANSIALLQAYELSVLTGTQVLLLVVSETGLVYTFTTPKLQPLVTKPEGKNLIQVSLVVNTAIAVAALIHPRLV